MDPVRIPAAADLVGFVQAIRAHPDGQIYAEVAWELRSGRISAAVLNDQVLVEASQSDQEIQEHLEARAAEVAAAYLEQEGDQTDVLADLNARLVNRR
jgi:hypothetical protein